MPTIDATVGGKSSNSYETYAEASTYFDERLPLSPPWIASGQEAVLVMATRVLDALQQPRKTLFPTGSVPYYRIHPRWTGTPATRTQRLAWPRVGMFDRNGNPLDFAITITQASPLTVITTEREHNYTDGQTVLVFQVSGNTPEINGERVVTVIDDFSFSVGVDTTVVGTGGRVTSIPQELKNAEAELAGQLLGADRTLDNDVIVQGISSLRAGSVSMSFNKDIIAQVLPDAVMNLLPQSWLTEELYEPANTAEFDIVSD